MVRRCKRSEGNLPLFEPASDWQLPNMAELHSWAGAKRVCVDIETRDDRLKRRGGLKGLGNGCRRGGYIVGIGFAIDGGPKAYLPFRHAYGDNLPEQQVLAYVRDQARALQGELVVANASYDLQYLHRVDVRFPSISRLVDVLALAPLLNEHRRSYALDEVCLWLLGERGKDEAHLKLAAAEYNVHEKNGLWMLPARHVGRYVEGDVDAPLRVWAKLRQEFDEQKLWKEAELEMAVTMPLIKMMERGVRVSLDHMDKVDAWSLAQERERLAYIKHVTGVELLPGQLDQKKLTRRIFEAVGVNVEDDDGKVVINKITFDTCEHPVGRALQHCKKMEQLRKFSKGIRMHLTAGDRLHCSINQSIAHEETDNGTVGHGVGTRSGRMSMTHENLQQQPSRDWWASEGAFEEAAAEDPLVAAQRGTVPFFRSVYLPEEGGQWVSSDYSAQEPRWIAEFALRLGVDGAKRMVDAWLKDPKMNPHRFAQAMSGLAYKPSKNMALGLGYSMGSAKLCWYYLNLPTRWQVTVKMPGQRWSDRERVLFDTEREADQYAQQAQGDCEIRQVAGEEGQRVMDQFNEKMPHIQGVNMEMRNRAQKGYLRTLLGGLIHFEREMFGPDKGKLKEVHAALNKIVQRTAAQQTKIAIVNIDREMPQAFMMFPVHDSIEATLTGAEAARVKHLMEHAMKATVPFIVNQEVGPDWGLVKKV